MNLTCLFKGHNWRKVKPQGEPLCDLKYRAIYLFECTRCWKNEILTEEKE